MHLFLHKSEACGAEFAGILGVAEIDALRDNRPFSYAALGDPVVGMWARAIVHPVLPMPTGADAIDARSEGDE